MLDHAVGEMEKGQHSACPWEVSLTRKKSPPVDEYTICAPTIIQEMSGSRDRGWGNTVIKGDFAEEVECERGPRR